MTYTTRQIFPVKKICEGRAAPDRIHRGRRAHVRALSLHGSGPGVRHLRVEPAQVAVRADQDQAALRAARGHPDHLAADGRGRGQRNDIRKFGEIGLRPSPCAPRSGLITFHEDRGARRPDCSSCARAGCRRSRTSRASACGEASIRRRPAPSATRAQASTRGRRSTAPATVGHPRTAAARGQGPGLIRIAPNIFTKLIEIDLLVEAIRTLAKSKPPARGRPVTARQLQRNYSDVLRMRMSSRTGQRRRRHVRAAAKHSTSWATKLPLITRSPPP